MASQTQTTTAWGEMTAWQDDETPGVVRLCSICKHCHRVTEQVLPVGTNWFQAVQPRHTPRCALMIARERLQGV